jgi:hypothetical protein
MPNAKLPGLADEGDVLAGTVGMDLLEQCGETLIDGALGERRRQIAHGNLRIPRR